MEERFSRFYPFGVGSENFIAVYVSELVQVKGK